MVQAIQVEVNNGVLRLYADGVDIATVDPEDFVKGCEQARLYNKKTGQTDFASFSHKAPRGLQVA